jgi:hypothetical protein
MELARLQSLLYRLITAPNGVGEGLLNEPLVIVGGLEELIAGDERLSSHERLEIYADAYFYRLLDVFKEDYPATLAVLGETDFYNLITGYLIEYPPTEPSIFYAGRHLADFLANHPFSESRPFLSELARLERTLLESFHSSDANPLDGAAIAAIAPAEWPTIAMRTHPAVRLLGCEWHVVHMLRAIEAGKSWEAPSPGPVTILVWRQKTQVFYRELDIGERPALMLAQDGAIFAVMCEAIASECEDAEPLARINELLSRWLAAGLLISQT